jgi:hypothetical protein
MGDALSPMQCGEDNKVKGAHFHFEKHWLLISKFKEEVFRNITETFPSNKFKSALDMWKVVMA